jgi:hypothetical protein
LQFRSIFNAPKNAPGLGAFCACQQIGSLLKY